MIEIDNNNIKDIRTFVLFFLGWWVYFTQGVLGIRGIISQALLAIMVVWSFYYYFKVITLRYKNPVLKALSILLILYIVYGGFQLLFTPDTGVGSRAFDYVKKAIFSMTPIFGFYYLFKKLDISENWMIVIIVMLLLFGIGEYIDGVRYMERMIDEGIVRRSEDEMTISSTYRFVPILPLLFFITKRVWFKYAAVIIVLIFAVMGVKRGPIVLCAAGTIVILWDTLKHISFRKFKFAHFFILLVALGGGFVVLSRIIESNDYLFYRIELMLEGDSSGRDYIYRNYYNFFKSESNVFYYLFGHGADSTVKYLGGYAHNDWLEIALNQGLFGVIIYGIYYFQLIKQCRKSKVNNSLYMCLTLFILTSFVTSFLSMSINNQRIASHICLAYCLSLIDRDLISSDVKQLRKI